MTGGPSSARPGTVVCRPHSGPPEQRLLISDGSGYSVGCSATVAPAGLAAWALVRCRCMRLALAHRAGPAPGRRDRQRQLRPPDQWQAIRLALSPAPGGTPRVIRIDRAAPYVGDETESNHFSPWVAPERHSAMLALIPRLKTAASSSSRRRHPNWPSPGDAPAHACTPAMLTVAAFAVNVRIWPPIGRTSFVHLLSAYQPGRSLMRAGRERSTVITAALSSTTETQPAVARLRISSGARPGFLGGCPPNKGCRFEPILDRAGNRAPPRGHARAGASMLPSPRATRPAHRWCSERP